MNKKDLRWLIAGNAVSAFGNAVYLIAILLLLKQFSDSALTLGLFQFLALFPGFLLSPVTGAMVDRISRRAIIVVTDLVRGVIMITAGGLLFLPRFQLPSLLLSVALLAGVGHALFVPAVHALIPTLVPAERLHAASGMRAASSQVANLVGNAVGGALFVILGAPVLFLINGATFLISGIQESFIREGGNSRSVEPNKAPSLSLLSEARAGLKLLGEQVMLRRAIISQAGLFAISSVLTLAMPFIVIDELGYSESFVGVLFAVALAGGILAFVVQRRWSPARMVEQPLLFYAYVAVAVGFLLLLISIELPALMVVAFLSGMAAATIYLFAVTWIQIQTPANFHGRLFAVLEAASSFVAPTSYLAAGALLDALGGSQRWWLFLGMGVLSTLWASVLWLHSRATHSPNQT